MLVARAAIDDIFKRSYFDICKLDAVLDLLGKTSNTPAYRALRPLHCVHWTAMSAELRDLVPLLMNEALSPPPQCVATDVALQGVGALH